MAAVTKLELHCGRKMSQPDTITAANKLGKRIISNREVDERLVLSDVWKQESWAYPVWTGTLVAYKGRDKKLEDAIKYTKNSITYVFEVPKEFQNEKNVLLVVNHDFLMDGRELITPNTKGNEITYEISDKNQISILQNFSFCDGWLNADNNFGIPTGQPIMHGAYKRYPWPWSAEYVGLVTRGIAELDFDKRRYVHFGVDPSKLLGALVISDFDLKSIIASVLIPKN